MKNRNIRQYSKRLPYHGKSNKWLRQIAAQLGLPYEVILSLKLAHSKDFENRVLYGVFGQTERPIGIFE